MCGNRVVALNKWQKGVLQELHQVHFSIARIKAITRGYVWWPELNKHIELMAKSCTHCQRMKNTPPVAPLHLWNWPSITWQIIDFAEPFPSNVLNSSFSHSKWPEVVDMKKTTAEVTIRELC